MITERMMELASVVSEDKLGKLQKMQPDGAIEMIYSWVKRGQISVKEFKELLRYHREDFITI